MVHACPGAPWYAFLKRSHWILLQEFLRNGRGKPGLGQGFKVNGWKLKQPWTLVCDSATLESLFRSNWPLRRSEATLNCEPDNLSIYRQITDRFGKYFDIGVLNLIWHLDFVIWTLFHRTSQITICYAEQSWDHPVTAGWFKGLIKWYWVFAIRYWF